MMMMMMCLFHSIRCSHHHPARPMDEESVLDHRPLLDLGGGDEGHQVTLSTATSTFSLGKQPHPYIIIIIIIIIIISSLPPLLAMMMMVHPPTYPPT